MKVYWLSLWRNKLRERKKINTHVRSPSLPLSLWEHLISGRLCKRPLTHTQRHTPSTTTITLSPHPLPRGVQNWPQGVVWRNYSWRVASAWVNEWTGVSEWMDGWIAARADVAVWVKKCEWMWFMYDGCSRWLSQVAAIERTGGCEEMNKLPVRLSGLQSFIVYSRLFLFTGYILAVWTFCKLTNDSTCDFVKRPKPWSFYKTARYLGHFAYWPRIWYFCIMAGHFAKWPNSQIGRNICNYDIFWLGSSSAIWCLFTIHHKLHARMLAIAPCSLAAISGR